MSVDIRKEGGFAGEHRHGIIHWRLFSLLSGYNGDYKYRSGYVEHNTEDDLVFSWLIDINGWRCLPDGWFFASVARALPKDDFGYTVYLTSEVGSPDESNKVIEFSNGILYVNSEERKVVEKGWYSSEDCVDLTFVITGKLEYLENREELTEYIEELGGKVSDSLSGKTDYLICNDLMSTSSKMKKAKELGIPVITEKEFIQRFGEPDAFDIEYEDDEDDFDPDDDDNYDVEEKSFQCRIDREGNIIGNDDIAEECRAMEKEKLSDLIALMETGTDDPVRLLDFGMLYETGLAGVEKNLKTAWDYYLKAAGTGDRKAVSFVKEIFLTENKDELRELLKNRYISKEVYPVFFDLGVKKERPELTAELLEYGSSL